jgi:hypothetical protein
MRRPLIDESVLRRVERACARYERKLAGGAAGRRADGDIESQAEGFRAAVVRNEMRAQQVKKLVMDRGVHTTQLATFRGFGLHVDKLTREYQHETLKHLVVQAIDRWTCYGCSQAILIEICRDVFGLTVPSVP